MNILQHKSWHVYSQQNRDRVRRDEAKAEAEEQQTKERAIAADREHRLEILRQRAERRRTNLQGGPEEDEATPGPVAPVPNDTVAVTKTKGDHVNFWSDLEKRDTASKQGNPEHEAEVKAKEKKWDRTIAMHLDSVTKGQKPWYTTPNAGSMAASTTKRDDGDYVKVRDDPLQNMRAMLEKRKIAQEEKGERKRSRSPSSRKHPRTSRHQLSNTATEKPPEMSMMAKLRAERLMREQAERTKTMAILNPNYSDPAVHHQPTGRYNQQFNPHATTHAQSASRTHHRDRESRETSTREDRGGHEDRHSSSMESSTRYSRGSHESRSRSSHEDQYERTDRDPIQMCINALDIEK
ncbi:Leukocyte receptor cluster member 1 [Mortierella sp. AD031]|nr:Leukocyte receptor cluster member 1 [Mortierella sp. AD031]KAG0205132.1 Leukocyte receptor cluster member 1 [Mortierella sp. NVP41]